MFLSQIFRRGAVGRLRPRASRSRAHMHQRQRWSTHLEALECRSLMAVNVTLNGGTLEILYNQTDSLGVTATSDQNVIVEIEDVFFPFTTTRVNVYVPSNPISIGYIGPNVNQQTWVFQSVDKIVADVPNPTLATVFNNSLTFKGIGETTDRIIFAGSGISAAGRWSDETNDELQVLLETYGVDHHTITAGGIINVSGVFSNNENDASIHAIATVPEDSRSQYTGTVIVGEPTPIGGTLPNPRLQSNFIEIVGAELDILSDIVATDHVILRAGENAPDDARASLVLPYDVTLSGNSITGAPGRLELFSTKNIVQLASSTLIASQCVATSDNANVATSAGPWMISLGSVNNDFDTIALGMTSAPGDAVNPATEGRIGVRDVDDLTVADFGILAATGQVRLEAVGALNFAAPVQATGLVGRSDDSITSTASSVMKLGGLGIDLLATDKSPFGAPTGDITLNGPVLVQAAAAGTLVSNSIQGVGTVTIAGRFQSPDAGSTKFVSTGTTPGVPSGVVVTAPVQVGSTIFNAPGTAITVNTHDLSLISHGGTISIANVPGNAATPYALQATNIITLDASSNVSVGGSVVAGSIYGNPSALTATQALPSITIRGNNAIDVTTTGSLRTVAYNTDPNATTNPLVGLISIMSNDDPTAVTIAGAVKADGAVDIGGATGISGSVTVNVGGSITGRESVVIRTDGDVTSSGPIVSTGGTYTTAPASGSTRMPDVVIDAGNEIRTGGRGTIRAGALTAAGVTSYGTVTLDAQSDITIGAAIDTPGGVNIASVLGAFDLSALLRTSNAAGTAQAVTISTGRGMLESDLALGRIVTASLTLTNTGAGDSGVPSDIVLLAQNNQITTITSATNFSTGGAIRISNNGAMSIGAGGVSAVRDAPLPSTVELRAKAGISQSGPILANNLTVANVGSAAISLSNTGNDIDNFAASNPIGSVAYTDADGFETGVNRTAPLGVEILGTAVSLSSIEPFSTIRVVSGLRYNSLSIAAGTQSGATVGTVEFVTTSPLDNASPVGFRGTLRDMIRYVNDNAATYTINQTVRSQPMAVVFDESGYPVSTVTVDAALPVFNRPVTFDGGRLEATVPATRLNVTQGGTSVPYGLSFAPATPAVPGRAPAYPGSAGSSIRHTAIYGFRSGSALVLGSGNNTVFDFYAGLKADGSNDASTQNFVGLDINGSTATNNLVGSTVFDPTTVNRFGGNTSAGILIRNGASGTRVFGSVIGDDTGIRPTLANGDGIRIVGATGNVIGTPDEVQPDQTASVSNVIAGNAGFGVAIVNATAGTAAAGNVLRNNFITNNRVGVAVTASKFATLGGLDGKSANVIVSQKGDGVAIANATDVQVLGNSIGVSGGVPAANAGNGVSISAGSSRVQINAGNVIAANVLNGVAIGSGVTGVTITGNTIGGDGGVIPGNTLDGVAITAAIGNVVGAGNTITGNGRHGVSVSDSRAATLQAGNRVFGSVLAQNGGNGVFISGGSGTTIGGSTAGAANVITANAGHGIRIERSTKTGASTGQAIQGNRIGTNTNGDVDATLGNTASGISLSEAVGILVNGGNVIMNNAENGIDVVDGTGSTIGASMAANGNVIANNTGSGVAIGGRATGIAVMGNTIVNQVGDGVNVAVNVRGVRVGQTVTQQAVTGAGNLIRGNGGWGVRIGAGAQQVAVQGNSTSDNVLGAMTMGAGANAAAPATVAITSAITRTVSGGARQLVLSGSLGGTSIKAKQQYSVDVYASPATSTNPQGSRFLGRFTVTATADGRVTFTNIAITATVAADEWILASATTLVFDPGSTSRLSSAVRARLR